MNEINFYTIHQVVLVFSLGCDYFVVFVSIYLLSFVINLLSKKQKYRKKSSACS